MYNVLIVDDEQLMLTYLANNIASLCSSFQITGIAYDGLEAMELMNKQFFDLVITDIRMPEMDGLALAKFTYEANPLTKIIIISGYNEFEYARTAIKYQVTDYLVKPLNDDSLKEVLLKVKEQLDESRPSKYQFTCESFSHLENNLLKQQFLSAILEGDSNLIYLIFSELEKRQIQLAKDFSTVMVLSIDELKLLLQRKNTFDITSFHLKLNQICLNYSLENNMVCIYNSNGTTLLLLDSDTDVSLNQESILIYETINHLALQSELPEITAAVGMTVTDVLDLPLSYFSANDGLVLSLKKIKSPVLYESALNNADFIEKLNTVCNNIYTDYLSYSTQKLYMDIRSYCELFSDNINNAMLLRFGSHLIRYICQRSNIKSQYIKLSYGNLTENIDHLILSGMPSSDDCYKSITSSIEPLLAIIQQPVISGTEQIVDAAKKYILSHYNEQISLSLVADQVGVNSCYLSDLIHKNLGEPYSKYILRIRMEQAARLLKSNPNEKIYQISEKTGFVSTKHFISVFKKFYGVTPTSYIP